MLPNIYFFIFFFHIFSPARFNQSNPLDLSDRNCLFIMSNDSLKKRKKRKEKKKERKKEIKK